MNNLDILRAVAVLSVFVHHLSYVYHLNVPFFRTFGGVFGVQLFFVISGFLIIQSAQKYSLRKYLTHRFFRIYPAYILTFIVIGIFTDIIYLDRVHHDPWGLVSNVFLLQQLFPKHLILYDSLHVSWTLTVELIWYLVAPIIVLLFRNRLNKLLIASVLVSLVWVFFAERGMLDFLYIKQLAEIGLTMDPHRDLFLNNAFIALLCFFVFGAYVYYEQEKLKRINPLVLCLIFLVCTLFYYASLPLGMNPSFITGVGLSALLLLALIFPTVEFWPIKLISDISYSFYLTHFTVIWVSYNSFELHSNWGIFIVFLITVLVSLILYLVVERPFMRFARRIT